MNRKDILKIAISLSKECENGYVKNFTFTEELKNQIQNIKEEELRILFNKLFTLLEKCSLVHEYINELGKGNLDIDMPKYFNILSPYKQLQSNLKHLAWQMKQVLQGDYTQKINFLGSLSDSFNELVDSLKEKENLKKQIIETDKQHRLITENALDVIWIYNSTKDKFTYISPSVYQLRGYTVEEAMMQSGRESLTPESFKTIQNVFIQNAKDFEVNPNKFNPYIVELRQPCKNGQIIWIEVSAKISKNEFGEYEVIGVSRNISKRKVLEEQNKRNTNFHKVLAYLLSEFVKSTLDNYEDTINKMLSQIAHFFEADRAYLFLFSQTKIENVYEYCSENIKPMIDNIKKINIYEFPWLTQQLNEFKPVFYDDINDLPENASAEKKEYLKRNIKSIIRIPIKHNNLSTGFIGLDTIENKASWINVDLLYLKIISDTISEIISKHLIEKELHQSKINAELANMAKTKFLLHMSHELRTPLNNIIGFTQLLKSTNLDETQKTYLANANSSSQSLLSIINNTIDLSKIEASKVDLNIKKILLNQVIEQSIFNVKYFASQKQIELILCLKHDVPLIIYADEIKLNQILINLLNNAIKFTHQGHVELTILFEEDKTQKDIGLFTFAVSDTGIGMSNEEQKKLFSDYFHSELTNSDKYNSSGLGLVISNKLAKLMGTNIQVKSVPNKGSTFSFTVPTKYSRTNDISHKKFSNIKNAIIVNDYKRTSIVIADKLKSFGIKSTISSVNSKSIIQNIKEKQCDVLFINYQMSPQNGIEIIQEIKATENILNNVSIVLLLDDPINKELITEAQETGIHNKLMKPVKLDELFKLLKNLDAENTIIDNKKDSTSITKNQKIQFLNDISPDILIAEDVEINMFLIETLIKKLIPKANIIKAVNGEEAVKKFVNKKPNLVLMDIQMPVKNGYEATIEIRKFEQNKKRVPIIALTAIAFHHELQECLDAGMNGFLTKPINIHLLEKVLINNLSNLDKTVKNRTKNHQTDYIANFDHYELLNNIGNNKDTLNQLFELSIKQIKEDITQLKTSINNKDTQNIYYYAHKIKGVALNMHFNKLAKYAQGIEEKANSLKESANSVYKTLIDEIAFIEDISKYI